jgi:hypothetical protein
MTNVHAADRITPVAPRTPLTGWQWFRLVGNMVNLTTPIGLLVALVGGARIRRGPRGLFVGEGYRLKFPVASAFTIGSVITTTRTWPETLRSNPQLFDHEERHTWQYLCCIGLPFYPAYGVCMAWSMLRTGDRAARNFFERNAGLVSGGYRDKPVRPIGENIKAMIGQLRKLRKLRKSAR